MKWPGRLPTIPIQLTRSPAGLLEGWFGRMLLMLVLGYLLFTKLGPRRPEMPPAIGQSINRQITAAMSDIAVQSTAAHAGRIAVCDLSRDDSSYATGELRRQLRARGIAIQPDLTLEEKVRDIAGLTQRPIESAGAALAQGKRRDLDAVIFGALDIDGTSARLDLHLVDVHSGLAVPISIPPIQANPPSPHSSAAIAGKHVGHHFPSLAIWAIVALLLPIFTVDFLREMVKKESNRRNLFALSIYTMMGVLLMWLLTERTDLARQLCSIFVGGIAIFFYNVSVMTWALKMEK